MGEAVTSPFRESSTGIICARTHLSAAWRDRVLRHFLSFNTLLEPSEKKPILLASVFLALFLIVLLGPWQYNTTSAALESALAPTTTSTKKPLATPTAKKSLSPSATPSTRKPSALAGNNIWTNVGPYGGGIRVLAINPQDTDTVYAGTYGGIFRSTNGGGTWNAVNTGLSNTAVYALAIDPMNPTKAYAGTFGGGVFKSTNGGGSWSTVNTGLSNTTVYALAINPQNTETVYAGTYGGIFKSTNGGGNWNAVNAGLSSTTVYALAIDPQNTGTVYAGTDGGGVFKSTNNGENWSAVNTGLSSTTTFTLAIDPQNTGTVYSGTYGGVYKSTNGGGNWSAVNNGSSNTYVYTLAIDPQNPGTLYRGMTGMFDGVFKSTDGGANWSAVNNGLSNAYVWVFALAISPQNTDTVYIGTWGGGVAKSTNGGASWSAANNGLSAANVISLAIDSQNPGTVYAGTDGGGLFKSTDSGGNWGAVNTGLSDTFVYSVAIDPQNSGTVYAGTSFSSGVYKSTDSGANWSAVNAGFPNAWVYALAINPQNPETIYAGTYNSGVFKSTNGGESWSAANNGLSNMGVIALTIDPLNTNTVYVGTYGGGIFKSTDSGGNWNAFNTGLSSMYVSALAIDPQITGTIYAGTQGGGVFKSTNGGGNWTAVNTGLTYLYVSALVIDPWNPGTVYAGTYSGVFRSTDSGGSWSTLNSGLTITNVRVLAINLQNPITIYAGTNGGGVFVNVLIPASSISGRVTSNSSTPIAGVIISDGAGHFASTNSTGYYALSVLTPGTYTIVPTLSGYSFSPSSLTVVIPPGASNQNFTGTQFTYSISGHVSNNSAGSLSGVAITDGAGHTANSDSNGNYTLSGLIAGKYQITPIKSGYSFSPSAYTVTVGPNATGNDFTGSTNTASYPPVVIVHGWLGLSLEYDDCSSSPPTNPDLYSGQKFDFDLGNFPRWLSQDGIKVWIAHIKSSPLGTPSVARNADCLAPQIKYAYEHSGYSPVILIGHSMGGIVSRYYLSEYANYGASTYVSKFITLGSPHTGEAPEKFQWLLNTDCSLNQQAVCDMTLAGMNQINQRIAVVPQRPYYFIAGTDCDRRCQFFSWLFNGLSSDSFVSRNSSLGIDRQGNQVVNGTEVQRFTTFETHQKNFAGIDHNWYMAASWLGPDVHTDSYNCIVGVIKLDITNFCIAASSQKPKSAAPRGITDATQLVSTQNGHIYSGQIVSRTVQIDANGASVFGFLWSNGSIYPTLTDPTGQTIDLPFIQANPALGQFQSNNGNNQNPVWASYALTSTTPGVWTINLAATDVPVGGTSYKVLASVESARVLSAQFDRSLYQIGQTANITATLRNSSGGISGASIEASISRWDGVTTTLSLSDSGGGNYSATYVIPNSPGYATAVIDTIGNDGGNVFLRETSATFQIASTNALLTNSFLASVESVGGYKSLKLDTGINASAAGSYIITADLVKNGTTIAHSLGLFSLMSGVQTAPLRFGGADICQSKTNGPYTVTNLSILDEQAGGVPAQMASNVFTTQVFNYAQFCTNYLYLPLIRR